MTDTNTTLDLLEMQTQIHKVTLSKYRRGLGIPKGENLVRIATAMKVSVDWLLFGTGNMYRRDKERD